MATLALISPPNAKARLLERHRAATEQTLAAIREDASLDDRERARRATQVVAEANARVLALASRSASRPAGNIVAMR